MAWSPSQRYLAEFLGTFALLLFGGGAAVFSAPALDANARVVLVSLAFGITVLGGAYAFGDISGGHFNPAVTLSMALSRRMPPRDVVPYLVAQVLGGIVGIAVVAGIAQGSGAQWATAQAIQLGSQCYASTSLPLGTGCNYTLASVFLIELALTFLFVLVIQLVTRPENSTRNLAPLAIGLTLLVTNLVAIPVDGASINPARSFSPALLSAVMPGWTHWALGESWLFWVAPILGGLLAGVVERMFHPRGSA